MTRYAGPDRVRFVAPDLRALDATPADAIACGVYEDERPMRGVAGLLDWRLAGRFSALIDRRHLTGKNGEVMLFAGPAKLPFTKVLLFGLGVRAAFDDHVFRAVLSRYFDRFAGLALENVILELPGRSDDAIDAARAAELLVELGGVSDRLTLVEHREGATRIAARLEDEQRKSRRV
ncbi:hypothetical protein BH09MYX1_BH09MYX1_42730 [soil metagenome]